MTSFCYAVARTILGGPGSHALHWVREDGTIEPWGRLTFLAADRLHVEAPQLDVLTQGTLPWFLAPLRGEG